MEIRCTLQRSIYQAPESGWAVVEARLADSSETATLTGTFFDVVPGMMIIAEGCWKDDPRYGRGFTVAEWRQTMPATLDGIEKYLASGTIKGIGPATAKAIVKKFGLKTISILDDHIERLYEVAGIGKKRVESIRESWEEQKGISDMMVFFQGNGVSRALAAKIYQKYGKESVTVIKDNPYILADEFRGVGFRTADAIALKMGYERADLRRCSSGLLYTLNEMASNGHVFATLDQLLEEGMKLLGVDAPVIVATIKDMLGAEMLICEDEAIYLPKYYYAERGSAKLLSLLASCQIKNKGKRKNKSKEVDDCDVDYDDVQRQAIDMAMRSKVLVLTGGPGTGKTTTTKGIISAFKERGMKILLAAPTGRAAQRLSESTKMEAKTIHRLLEYQPPKGFLRDDENPLMGDALIVDECSMVDIQLFYSLMKAVPRHMRLILVGDIDQLPSVGAGNVLRDIITSERIPVVRLTRIFRQAQSSRIVMNAHAINNGRLPDISNGRDTDFFFLNEDNEEDVLRLIVDLVSKRLPAAYGVSPKSIQVLAPMLRGPIGTLNLNQELQNAVNPRGVSLKRNGQIFRVGDKVMQTANNYDKNVFNGDIGYIAFIDPDELTMKVRFDKQTVEYEYSEMDELMLSYAATIHKSQGSEFPIVVMPVSMKHYIMLQRNLIYTGITRAKKLCVLVGSTKALAYAVSNQPVNRRNSLLDQRLKDFIRS